MNDLPRKSLLNRSPRAGLGAGLALLALLASLAAGAQTPSPAAPATPATAAAAEAPASAPAAVPAAAAASAPPEAAASAAAAPAAPPPPLDARVQALKAELVRLNRDLLVLEEELLFPAGTQVAVFLSLDLGRFFALESVQLKLNDQLVSAHLYTPLQLQALQRGGMQRLWLGNLKTGKHRIDAFFTGQGPKTDNFQREYKRGATLEFDKGGEPRYIELRIRDAEGKLQPEFEVKVWP
jgi:nucleoid-associated protein YgaU